MKVDASPVPRNSTPDAWASWGKKELAKGPIVSGLTGFFFSRKVRREVKTWGILWNSGLGFEGRRPGSAVNSPCDFGQGQKYLPQMVVLRVSDITCI